MPRRSAIDEAVADAAEAPEVESDEQEEEDCTDEDADTDDDGWLGGDGDAELSDGEDDDDCAGTKKRKAPGGQGKNARNWGPEGEERN